MVKPRPARGRRYQVPDVSLKHDEASKDNADVAGWSERSNETAERCRTRCPDPPEADLGGVACDEPLQPTDGHLCSPRDERGARTHLGQVATLAGT